MATVPSTGSAGGALDVATLVGQLVAAERAPEDKRLTKIDAQLTTELSAVSQLKGALSTFQSSLLGLKDSTALSLRTATSSDETTFSASATSSAAPGSYTVRVVQLAKAAQLTSGAFAAGPTSAVGYGTLTLSIGGKSFDVTLDAAHNTLADIQDAINAAPGNAGVQASILTTGDGSRLILTGNATGAANAVTVTQSGGDGGLSQLVYNPPAASSMTLTTAAQDATVNINGFATYSATNTVAGAIGGVVLTLKKEAPTTDLTLTVAADNASVQTKVQAFVSAYNTLAQQMASLRSYDATNQKAGPLLGDAMLQGIESKLRSLVSGFVVGSSAPYQTLSSIGVSFAADGTLAFDAAKYQKAVAADPNVVSKLFAGTNGVGKLAYTYLDSQLAAKGAFATRNDSIAARRKDLVARQDALNVRMQVFQARYTKQFSALDSLLTQMQSTSNFLTQQLSKTTSK